MPISQGSGGSGIPGVMLKAWVLMDNAGNVVRSMNVSSVVKGVTGTYTVNFTAAMLTTTYLTRYSSIASVGKSPIWGRLSDATTAAATLSVANNSGVANDTGGMWEFYE